MEAEDIFSKFQRKAQAAHGINYMSFKKGDWVYGAEGDEMDQETKFVGDLMTMKHGWQCWCGGQVIDQVYVSVLEGDAPMEEDLPDHSGEYQDPAKDGWSFSTLFFARELDGAQQQFQIKGGSKGFSKASGELCEAFVKEGRERGDQTLCPVFQLHGSSYKHPTFGKIPTPVFHVTGWMTKAEAEKHFGGQEALEKPKEEKKKLERK